MKLLGAMEAHGVHCSSGGRGEGEGGFPCDFYRMVAMNKHSQFIVRKGQSVLTSFPVVRM